MAERTYIFDDFQIDPARRVVTRLPEGEPLTLTHKAFQVLMLLVENQGTLVSKDEIMATVWRDTFVEDANLTQTISVLRKALGENPNQHRLIVTETGKGYRFVAPVSESGEVAGDVEKSSSPSASFVRASALVAIIAAIVLIQTAIRMGLGRR